MEGAITLTIIGGVIFLFSFGFSIWNRAVADEMRLQAVQKEINAYAISVKQDIQIQSLLAKEFKVEPSVVMALHSDWSDWGSITIELAMAQRLVQAEFEAYPNLIEALRKIESLRNKKTSKIAKSLGFKLHPVLNVLEHVRNELCRADRIDSLPMYSKPEIPCSSPRLLNEFVS